MIPSKYHDPRWLDLREQIKERDGFECQSCKSGDKLHVHHLRYDGDSFQQPWLSSPEDLLTLCGDCHDNLEFSIKLLRESAHIRELPHIVNRTVMAHDQLSKRKPVQILDWIVSLFVEEKP